MLLAYEFKLVFFVGVSVVALVSVIGNVLAITSFLKRKVLRTSTNYYITSMAVSDLLFVVTDGALYASSSLSSFVISLTSFGCKLGRYCPYVSYSVSILSLVLITVDRFIATVFPMKVTMITRRARMFFILLTWLVPTGLLVPLLYSAKVSEESDGPYICGTGTSGLTNSIYNILGVALYYCVPFITIIILSSLIMKSLRRANPVIEGNGQTNARQKQNQRIMRLLISIDVLFFICWTPTYVNRFLLTFFPTILKRNIQEILYILFSYFLPFISTAANPLILFTFSTNYRQAMKDCLRLAVVKCCSCFVREQAARE